MWKTLGLQGKETSVLFQCSTEQSQPLSLASERGEAKSRHYGCHALDIFTASFLQTQYSTQQGWQADNKGPSTSHS